ncbi:MAG: GldG family protein [Clostridia bacterium]|nr:GldG family protein [Clostridia bacterium]
MNFLHGKKFRYGSVSVALTVVIIAAVILLNAIFTALSEKFVWYIDMTAEEIYTLSDEAKVLLDQVFYNVDEDGKRVSPRKYVDTATGEERDVEATIIFCSTKDTMEAEATQRYVLYTVLEMAKEYDNIKIKYVDYLTNPSAVSQYKESSGQSINAYSVIVTSGTQSRVYSLSSLFMLDSSDSTSIVGYNGEQRLVSALHAVTQVETPIACYTIGHGETDSLIPSDSSGSPILTLLYETGYDVRPVDLSKEALPEDCSLVLIFDPQSDFMDIDSTGISDISEIDKLKVFLDQKKSVMVFFDYETPTLPNLEAFLKEWGVEIARNTDAASGVTSNYLIKDQNNSFTANGLTNVATYAETGLGASLTRQLRSSNYPKSVVFQYTSAIKSSYTYSYDETNECEYGTYYSNGVQRDIYDVFTSSKEAVALGGEKELDVEGPFKYMTVTREMLDDGYSYLLACASTDFASAGALDSAYGNHTVLTRACHELGGAQISVSLDAKYFTDTTIDSITTAAANQYTIVLTVVPASIIFIAGIYIMVRRKYA